jgi:hypothetical protein
MRYLRNACPLGEACPLSHDPNGHRMPHCTKFPDCKYGAACRYPHVHVSPRAAICRPFATVGYCDRGLACPERHVRECPEFSDKGTCSTKGCRLPHIIRKRRDPAAADDALADAGNESVVFDYDDSSSIEDEDAAVSADLLRKRERESSDGLAAAADEPPSSPIARRPGPKKPRLGDGVADQQDFLQLAFDEGSSVEVDRDGEELDFDVDSDIGSASD